MFRTFVPIFSISLVAACSSGPVDPVDEALAVARIEQAWIAGGFESPEGVAPAPDGGYFISNVVGEGSDKDGNGYISHLAADGSITTRNWAAKLDAPKGMAVLDGALYAADIDRVVMVDVENGERLGAVGIEGAKFLNDATDWNGAIYVSDSGDAAIYRISGGAAELWLQDERLAGVNGLLGDGDRMLVSTMTTGSLFSVTTEGDLTEIASGMEDADGIGLVPGGGYLVSSWPGQIHYVGEDGAVTTLVDGDILQNDLTVIGGTVIVPNWAQNTVTTWTVSRP
ncbi:MAG: hypothetical protein R3265_00825 [Hyphomonas sp.]|nr:hypothetical protein [Hyphomonas sp.]